MSGWRRRKPRTTDVGKLHFGPRHRGSPWSSQPPPTFSSKSWREPRRPSSPPTPTGCSASGTLRAEALFGYTAQEALGQTLNLIVPEDYRGRHWTGCHRTVKSGTTKYLGQLLEALALTKGGKRIKLEFSFILLHDERGELTGLAVLIRKVEVPPRRSSRAASPAKVRRRRRE